MHMSTRLAGIAHLVPFSLCLVFEPDAFFHSLSLFLTAEMAIKYYLYLWLLHLPCIPRYAKFELSRSGLYLLHLLFTQIKLLR